MLPNHIKALLFDLDGTLLDMDLKGFIKGYFKGLADKVAHLIPAKVFISALLNVSKVVQNNQCEDTNENLYYRTFFPINGYQRDEIEPLIIDFYANDFSNLRIFSKSKPMARTLLERAQSLGYKLVIATTPIIPKTAILQRLEWANIRDFSYDIITSYENTCAVKPNLLYFSQIFKKLGLNANQCLMVGDEHKDMVAKKLGCHTFLVRSSNTNLNKDTPNPDYEGTLSDLLDLIIT